MKRLLLAFYRFYLHFCKDDLETALAELQERQLLDPAPDYMYERASEELRDRLDHVNQELGSL